MSKFWAVVGWEFLRAFRSKQFIVTTVVIPLIFGISGAIPVLVQKSQTERVVYFADRTGVITPAMGKMLAAERIELRHEGQGDGLRDIDEGRLTGILAWADDGDPGQGFRLLVRHVDARTSRLHWALQRVLTEINTMGQLEALGVGRQEMERLLAPVPVALHVLDDISGDSGAIDFVPLAFAVMLMLSAFLSGHVLMQSIIKERQNRIGELLFSSMPAPVLMNGKVAAFGALGLVQLIVWTGAALGVASYFWDFDPTTIRWRSLAVGLPHFLAGYLMFAGMFAALGAGTRDAQSGGQAQGLFAVIPLIPLMLASPIMMDPHGLWVKLVGYVPILTPGITLLRLGITSVSPWEYGLTLAISVAGAWLALRAAQRIFFYGMLLTGRPAKLGELVRWVAGR